MLRRDTQSAGVNAAHYQLSASGYLYNEAFVLLTAAVEFVWLSLCVCLGVPARARACVSFRELRT